MEPSEGENKTADKTSNGSGSTEKAWEDFQNMDKTEQEFKKDVNGNPLYNRRTIDVSQLDKILPKNATHGLTGSQNLGNTCFMNSSIQCMSNSIDLTAYFLTKQYEKEINTDNKLGLGGKLAKAWYNLLYEFWMEKNRVSDAREFKSTIAKRARQFSGYNQHDSHELMTFFLDTLNEDLNKATDKPYREISEQQKGESDASAAARFWELHVKRNDSIITDLFSGQFKTTITCPNCKWVSKTYDPFTTLSLPIPTVTGKDIFFIPKYSLHKTIKMNLKITDYTLCGDLNKLMASIQKFNYQIGKIRCFIISEKKLICKAKPDDNLIDLFKKGFIFCSNLDYEVEDSKEECTVVPLYLGTEVDDELSAYPRMLTLHNKMTFDEFKKILYIYARKFIFGPKENKELEEEIEKVSDETNYSEEKFIELCKEEYDKTFKTNEPSEDIKKFIEDLPIQIYLSNEKEKKYILKNPKTSLEKGSEMLSLGNETDSIAQIINMTNQGYDIHLEIYKPSKYTKIKDGRSFNFCSSVQGGEGLLSLTNCLETFCITEKLGENDKWYCKNCKNHVAAYKKMELFYLPKLLVIHLKRFASETSRYRGYGGWGKNNSTIDFPINNFDPSAYLVGPQKERIKYDLYAVSQHYGGCGGGHYTAICKNYGQWYEYDDSHVSLSSESNIVTGAAYVLFYRRKDD